MHHNRAAASSAHSSRAGGCSEASQPGSKEVDYSDRNLLSSKGADCSVLATRSSRNRSQVEASSVLWDRARTSSSKGVACSAIWANRTRPYCKCSFLSVLFSIIETLHLRHI